MSYNPHIHHRRSIRLKGYDYARQGAYFITICCSDRQCLFGQIIDGEMQMNRFGQIAYAEWFKTEIRPHALLNAFVIMPNHIHGIIYLNEIQQGRSSGLDRERNASRGVSHTPIAYTQINIRQPQGLPLRK